MNLHEKFGAIMFHVARSTLSNRSVTRQFSNVWRLSRLLDVPFVAGASKVEIDWLTLHNTVHEAALA